MKWHERERWVALLTVMGAVCALWAPNIALASSDAADRARISQARAEADAVLATKQAECRQRFAVNDCLLEVRKEHRAVVDPLRKELLLLDDKQRKQRAADRTERIRAKTEAQNEAGSVALPAASGAASFGAAEAFPRATIRPKIRSMGPSASASEPAMTVETAAPVALPASAESDVPFTRKAVKTQPTGEGYQTLRVRQAEARRQSVLQKNAERDAKKPPAKPLPVPAP
ncbi:MAG: hypothetical protein B7Y51_01860 [Burkholderiales bacterium 28-67-8]|nr:MAG: hypothetical protein B7Y51_01860 [Burkholderiales bacterium 28-67-8]